MSRVIYEAMNLETYETRHDVKITELYWIKSSTVTVAERYFLLGPSKPGCVATCNIYLAKLYYSPKISPRPRAWTAMKIYVLYVTHYL